MKGYDTPIVISDRPILGARYGVHWNYAPPDGSACRRDEAVWRNISGIVLNTPKGAAWLFFRRWKYKGCDWLGKRSHRHEPINVRPGTDEAHEAPSR